MYMKKVHNSYSYLELENVFHELSEIGLTVNFDELSHEYKTAINTVRKISPVDIYEGGKLYIERMDDKELLFTVLNNHEIDLLDMDGDDNG